MDRARARTKIEGRFTGLVDNTPQFHNATVLIHAHERGVNWKLAAGQINGESVHPDQPFHAMSVGKTFTSTIIAMLHDEDVLRFDDNISCYLPKHLLDGLHVFQETEYTDEIQIHHLLNQTSGLPHLTSDEFGILSRRKEQSADGQTFFDLVNEDPERFWEPEETIEWAKEHLHPHFPPGEGIYYSEVGYNLLGLIIERVTGLAYHEVLQEYLFGPLSMDHSYLSQFSEPAVESDLSTPPLYDGDERFDIEQYRSFSAWFAGGQTVSTTGDLLQFHRALVEERLVSESTLEEMTRWKRLSIGLDYGYGMLRIRPIPLLSKYYAWGGLGFTSSFMLYNPGSDAYVIGSFNQSAARRKAFNFVFRTLRAVSKIAPSN